MTPQEEHTLEAFNERLRKPVEIRLALSDDPRSREMQAFCRRLGEIAPHVKIVEDAEETGPLPALWIGERLCYCGIPTGNELAPFLEALCFLDADGLPILPSLSEDLNTLEAPANLQVYVAPSCGFCPAVVSRLLPLPFAFASIYLTVIDVALFPETAAAQRIKSVPTLVVDDQLRWTGMVDVTELSRAVVNRDPAMLGSESLLRMLRTEGGAYDLAGMMHRCAKVFPAFADLLADARFTVRLAAMVAVEDLLDRDPDLALQVVQPMLKRYPEANDAVKGDLLYLFGQIKAKEALPLLHRAAASDPNAEIREAAVEALEKIALVQSLQ
jgi:hypothetical protein